MKRFFISVICLAAVLSVSAAPKADEPKVNYVDALELTMIGKLCETTNPYHRVEVDKVEGISNREACLLKMSSGLAITFKTNSNVIYVKPKFGSIFEWHPVAPFASTTGFNLFIKNTEV